MTTRIRIDEVVEGVTVRVRYTMGEPPLPAEPGGNEREFPNKQAFADFMAEQTGNPSVDMLLAGACAATFKANPQLSNLSAYTGRFFQIDFEGAAQAVVAG